MKTQIKKLFPITKATEYAFLSVLAHSLFLILFTVYLVFGMPAYETIFRKWALDVSAITAITLEAGRFLWGHPVLYVFSGVIILSVDAAVHYLCDRFVSPRAVKFWGWIVAVFFVLVIGLTFLSVHIDFARLVSDLPK